MANTLGEVFRLGERQIDSVVLNGEEIKGIVYNGELIYPSAAGNATSADYGGTVCAFTVSDSAETWTNATENGSFYVFRYDESEYAHFFPDKMYLRFGSLNTGDILAKAEDFINESVSLYYVETQDENGEWKRLNISDCADESVNGNYRIVSRMKGGV